MSAPGLVYWQGDAYAWDDGELVAVHNVGDVRVIGADA
jgi:predicted heme/steroid binding protein